jgi:hypothetical protein
MALFGRQRDINLFTTITRELMGDIITQQCAFYKYKLEQTAINIAGEACEGRFFAGPTLFNCLIERQDQQFTVDDFGVEYARNVVFRFLREDLIDANLVPEVGDVILYNGGYYEVDSSNSNQYLFGKDPDYPNETNPLNPGLSQFGSNYSIICSTHYTPADKLGIELTRL